MKLRRGAGTCCLSRQRYVAHSVIFARLGFPRSSKTSESSSCRSRNHRKLRKGWRRCGVGGVGYAETMAGIMETNATSGVGPAALLLKEYRPFRVSSHCLSDSAKPKWAVTVLVLAAGAFRGSNFADALAASIFLGFLLRNYS